MRVNDDGAAAGAGEATIEDEIAFLRPRLVRFAWSLAHDADEADDLAQETIVHALAATHRFEPGTNLKAWLFRILRNIYLNRRRAALRHPPSPLVEKLTFDAGQDVEREVLVRADLSDLRDAFRGLPAAYAAPLYLTAVEQTSYVDAAAILDIPVGTVMSRVFRARRLLIARLGKGS
jgi:RNA polymerase sigma-70 factor (ECF subfamily)